MAISDKFMYQGVPLSELLQSGTFGTYPESKYKDSSTQARGIQGVNGSSNIAGSIEMSKYFHYAGQTTPTYFLTKAGLNFYPSFGTSIGSFYNSSAQSTRVIEIWWSGSGNKYLVYDSETNSVTEFTTTKTRMIAIVQAAGGAGGGGMGAVFAHTTGGGGGAGASAAVILNLDKLKAYPSYEYTITLGGPGEGKVPSSDRTESGGDPASSTWTRRIAQDALNSTIHFNAQNASASNLLLTIGGGHGGESYYTETIKSASTWRSGGGGSGGQNKNNNLVSAACAECAGHFTNSSGTSAYSNALSDGFSGTSGGSGSSMTVSQHCLLANAISGIANNYITLSSYSSQGRGSGANSFWGQGGTSGVSYNAGGTGGWGAGGGGGDSPGLAGETSGGHGDGSFLLLYY